MMKRIVLAILLGLLAPVALAHSVVYEDGAYKINHTWTHKGVRWTCSLSIDASLYNYYGSRTHYGDDYVHYVLSEYDRDYIRSLVKSFRSGGEKYGYSEVENVMNVISFVQSLKYVYDSESTGQSDYVRFPVETLVDGVGDCEDMAILVSAILYEMGYGVLLVAFPDHLAVAVKCGEGFHGTYYEYAGAKYYYLEMTATGWDIGQIPERYRSATAKLIPLINKPKVRFESSSYSHDSYYTNAEYVDFDLECILRNIGPGSTDGLQLHVEFKLEVYLDYVFARGVYDLSELLEGEMELYRVSIPVPRPFSGVIVFHVEGKNFDTESMFLEGIVLP